jgi:hypothetical protein
MREDGSRAGALIAKPFVSCAALSARSTLAAYVALVIAITTVSCSGRQPPSRDPSASMASLMEHEVRSIRPPRGWKLVDTKVSGQDGIGGGYSMRYAGNEPTVELEAYLIHAYTKSGWKYCGTRVSDYPVQMVLSFRKSNYSGSSTLSTARRTTYFDISAGWAAIGALDC